MALLWREWCWALSFCAICCGVYFPIAQDKQKQVRSLSCKLKIMENELFLAQSEREHNRLQIASQTDPSWIEMLLMRDLGVVPEGWIKVHFKK